MAAIKPLERIACEQCAPCLGAGVDASGKLAINVEYRPFSLTWFDANLKLSLEYWVHASRACFDLHFWESVGSSAILNSQHIVMKYLQWNQNWVSTLKSTAHKAKWYIFQKDSRMHTLVQLVHGQELRSTKKKVLRVRTMPISSTFPSCRNVTLWGLSKL